MSEKNLPTRKEVVKEALAVGLTPAEAHRLADIEVEMGMAKDDE